MHRIRTILVVVLATPAMLAILGLVYQLTVHSEWLANVLHDLGSGVVWTTVGMGAAAALCSVWTLVVQDRPGRGGRVLVVAFGLAGGLYAAALTMLHLASRDGVF